MKFQSLFSEAEQAKMAEEAEPTHWDTPPSPRRLATRATSSGLYEAPYTPPTAKPKSPPPLPELAARTPVLSMLAELTAVLHQQNELMRTAMQKIEAFEVQERVPPDRGSAKWAVIGSGALLIGLLAVVTYVLVHYR